jgi:hypothetical protein
MGPVEAQMLALLAAGGAVISLLAWWLIRWIKKVNQRIDRAWEAAAARVSGGFQRQVGPWYNRVRNIDARAEGVAVLVDHYTVSTGKSSQTFTRLRATAPHAGALRLKVSPRHLLSGLGRALGFQDVTTGDGPFDEAFVVKASDEQLARSWLTPAVREAIAQSVKYGFSIKDGELTVQLGELDTDADRLTAAIGATAVLAGTGQRLVDRWEQFATSQEGALSKGADGGVRIEIDQRSVPLRIDASVDEKAGTVTRIRARVLDADAERYELAREWEALDSELRPIPAEQLELPGHFVVASSAPEQTARRLSSAVRDRLPALAPLRVESDGEDVTVVLPGIETDEARLQDAVDLASALAAETGKGAYR